MALSNQITNRKALKFCFQISFFCLFLWFSLSSIQSFYLGEVIYDLIIKTDNEKVFFPAVTLCPNERSNPFMNLKLDQLRKALRLFVKVSKCKPFTFEIHSNYHIKASWRKDKNLSDMALTSYIIFNTFKSFNVREVIKNYSYTEMESFNKIPFHSNQIR